MRIKNKINKFIYWSPRILSILFLCFLAMFSLDVIEPGRTILEITVGLFMHNIPVFILTALLAAAWKREIIGAIAFFLAGLLYVGFVTKAMLETGFEWYYLAWIVQIAGISFFIGMMFLLNWTKRKERQQSA